MIKKYYYNELYHHGIKGQKWGIRRSKEELNRDPISRAIAYKRLLRNGIVSKNNIKIIEVSDHIITDARPDRIQFPKEVISAVKNPVFIEPIKYNSNGDPSILYIGSKACAVVNPNKGTIVTAFPTTPKRLRQARKKGGSIV